MDIKNVIDSAVREVLNGVDEAKKSLHGIAGVGYPTRIELEVGITSTYEIANYDDVRVATVRVSIPVFKNGEEASSPASAALDEAIDLKVTDKKKKK